MSMDIKLVAEIVRLLKLNNILIVDNQLSVADNKEVVIISSLSEITDNSKTFDRVSISVNIGAWGKKNGNSYDIKVLKNKIIEALIPRDKELNDVYELDGFNIDFYSIENIQTYKELESSGGSGNGSKTTHFFHCDIIINYKIRGM